MYEVGTYIYYGSTGVCQVTDVSERQEPGGGKGRKFYTLKPTCQECTIYTPVENQKVFMRPIITRDEANRLIDMIPTIQAQPYHSRVISQLVEHYRESISTCNCEDLIEMTMSIYAKKQYMQGQKRKFGAVDERFMKRAEELLFYELAAALEMEKDEVPEYIARRIDPSEPIAEQTAVL